MANYASAVLVKAQPKLIGAFQNLELRYRDPSVHKLFVKNNPIMLPDYNSLLTRQDRAIETNYKERTSRALGSAISHNHTGAAGDSAVLTPTWTAYTDVFATTLKQAGNKIYTMDEIHTNELFNSIINMVEGLDTAAAAYLFANRSGVNVAVADGTFDATDDVFEITETTKGDLAVQITDTVAKINKYGGTRYTIVADSVAYNKFRGQRNQGAGNSYNTSFQFDGVDIVHAPALTAAFAGLVSAYSKGAWILVPEGSISSLPWIEPEKRAGVVTSVNKYSSIINPIDGLTYGLHTYETRADGTSLGGTLQDVVVETQVNIFMSYQHAPLSVAGETPLLAFALV